jgi:hypothetical protein
MLAGIDGAYMKITKNSSGRVYEEFLLDRGMLGGRDFSYTRRT